MVRNTTVNVLIAVTAISFIGALVLHHSLTFSPFAKAGKFLRRTVLADQTAEETPEPVNYRQQNKKVSNTLRARDEEIMESDEENKVADLPAIRPRLPKALIIGFSKCGTTALRTFLTLHPDIVSPIEEVRYFNYNFAKGLEWYRNQMPASSENQITLEKTPSYIMSPEVLKRIYLYDSEVRLIIIVRDPIIRLQSQYAHTFRNAPPEAQLPAFRFWVKVDSRYDRITHFVDYTKYIRQVYDQFPKKQVLVLAEEDFEQNPLSVMKEVESFLHIKPAFSEDMFYYNKGKGFYCFNKDNEFFSTVQQMVKVNNRTGCLGEDKGRDHPDIDPAFLKELVQYIRPHNENLFRLIGKRIIWENFE